MALKFDSDFEFLECLGQGSHGIVFEVQKSPPSCYKNDNVQTFALKVTALEDAKDLEKDREGRIYEKMAQSFDSQNIAKQYIQWQEIMKMEDANSRYKAIRRRVSARTGTDVPTLHSWAKSDRVKGQSHMFLKFYLMELCQRSLKNFTDDVKKNMEGKDECFVNNELIMKFLGDTISGLIEIHSQGLMHRDLKPGNILQGKDGVWKIADFGISSKDPNASVSEFDITASSPYRQNQNPGNPIFQAPEISRLGKYDRKVDIYSLGMTLIFVMLSHERMHHTERVDTMRDIGHDGSYSEAKEIKAAAYEKVENVFTKCGLGPDFFHLAARMTDYDPSQRPTAEECQNIFAGLPSVSNVTMELAEQTNDSRWPSVGSSDSDMSLLEWEDTYSDSSADSISILSDQVSDYLIMSEVLISYWKKRPRRIVYDQQKQFEDVIRSLAPDPINYKCFSITEQQKKANYYYYCKIPGLKATPLTPKTFIVEEHDGRLLTPNSVIQKILLDLQPNVDGDIWCSEIVPSTQYPAPDKRAAKLDLMSYRNADVSQRISVLPAISLGDVSGEVATELMSILNSCGFFDENAKKEILERKILLVPDEQEPVCKTSPDIIQWTLCVAPTLFEHMDENVGWMAGNLHGVMKTFHNKFTLLKRISPFQLLNVLLKQLNAHPDASDWTDDKSALRLTGLLEEWQVALENRKLSAFFFPTATPNLFRQDLSDREFEQLNAHVSAILQDPNSYISSLIEVLK